MGPPTLRRQRRGTEVACVRRQAGATAPTAVNVRARYLLIFGRQGLTVLLLGSRVIP
jgi:hypothetical protein